MSTEQESERIVLDHIDNISFDPNNPRLQNFHAIKYLSKGLYHLAATVRREELAYNRKLGGHIVFSLDAQDPVIDTVSCYFNWFAVSLDNYLRAVGLIQCFEQNRWAFEDLKGDPNKRKIIKQHCDNYSKKVAPEVNRWRNQVAAHFAGTNPGRRETVSTLATSVFLAVTFEGRHFVTGDFHHIIGGEPANIPKWSLTKVYEHLAPRLWPRIRLTKIPEISPASPDKSGRGSVRMVEVGPSTRKRQIALDTNQISAGFQQLMSLIDSTTLRDFIHLVTKSMTSPTGGPVGLVPTPDGKYRLILWPDVSNEEPDVVLLAEEIYRFERMPDKRVKGFEGWDFCTVGVEISRRLFSVEMTFGTLVEIPAVLTGHSVARKGVVIGYHTDLKDSRLKTELDLLVAPETPPD